MPFKKGASGNPNGRPKDPNKHKAKTVLRNFVIDKIENELPSIWASLEAKERADFLTKVIPYAIPKEVYTEEVQTTEKQSITIKGKTIEF